MTARRISESSDRAKAGSRSQVNGTSTRMVIIVGSTVVQLVRRRRKFGNEHGCCHSYPELIHYIRYLT